MGLLASTFARLVSSAFYALHDTKTPFRFALVRVIIAAVLSFTLSVKVPPLLGLEAVYGTAGLTLASGIAGWIEFYLLKRTLTVIIGPFNMKKTLMIKLWASAVSGIAAGWGIKIFLKSAGHFHPVVNAVFILGIFGIIYIALTFLMRISESEVIVGRIRALLKVSKN